MIDHDDLAIPDHDDLTYLVDVRPRAPRSADRDAAARRELLAHIEQASRPAVRRHSTATPSTFRLPGIARKSRWAKSLTAGGVIAALAVGVVGIGASTHRDGGLAQAAVLKRMRAAAASPTDRIYFSTSRHWRTWIDPKTNQSRSQVLEDGKVAGENRRTESTADGILTQHSTFLYNTSRKWGERTERYPAPTTPANASKLAAGLHSQPAAIVDALRNGNIRVLSRGNLDGFPAIKVQLAPNEGFDGVLWVDANSYEPLQLEESRNGKPTGVQRWLPRTAENLARLAPKIPAGWQKVDPDSMDTTG